MAAGTRPLRGLSLWAAWLLVAVAGILLALYLFPDLQRLHRWSAMAAAFVPYGVFAWGLATLLVLLATSGRRKAAAVFTGIALVVHSHALLAHLPRESDAEPGLTVMTVNLLFGKADLAELHREVARAEPDVLILTEVVGENMAVLDDVPWSETLAYRAGRPGVDYDPDTGSDASGTMVLSRHSLEVVDTTEGTHFDNLAVRVGHPAGGLLVVATHTMNPVNGVDGWLDDGAALGALVRRHLGEPMVVAGDLNATLEQVTMRDLLDLGLADAAAQAGAGWLPTYPADRWFPPLIAIDHVLVNDQVSGVTAHTFALSGTDHEGLVVGLRQR